MTAVAAESAMLDVAIWRGAEAGEFRSFAIPRRAHQTVLDVVTEIQREHGATLSYRFACRDGLMRNPIVALLEFGIVVTLAIHLTLGLRVFAIEFFDLREKTLVPLSVCVAVVSAVGLAFILNLG